MDNWQSFIKKLLDINTLVYLKGGAVIGIYLLKTIVNMNNFEILYEEYKKLNLINDFDFIINDVNFKNDYFYYEFGREYNISLNGKLKNKNSSSTLRVMRSNNNKFELSIDDDCKELPMTNMTILITIDNYENFFILFKNIINNTINHLHLLFLKNIDINIPIHDNNGMFCDNIHINIFNDLNNLSNDLISIIKNTTSDKNSQLCLYYLIKNPTNLSRCLWKNIEKSDKIKNYYNTYLHAMYPNWLLNKDLLLPLLDKFINNLNILINNIYSQYQIDIKKLVDEINKYDKDIMINQCLYDLSGINDYPKLKHFIKNKRDELRLILTNIYEEMFSKINDIFVNITILRWKNNIQMYKNLENQSAINCLYKIFNFDIQLKLLDGKNIINVKNITNNSIWQLIIELYK